MKFPKKVNILGKIYKIVYTKTPIDPEREDVFVWGYISPVEREIKLYKTEVVSEGELIDTLLHEIIHGVCYEIDMELEEEQVKRLASVLADTLVRNNMVKI